MEAEKTVPQDFGFVKKWCSQLPEQGAAMQVGPDLIKEMVIAISVLVKEIECLKTIQTSPEAGEGTQAEDEE